MVLLFSVVGTAVGLYGPGLFNLWRSQVTAMPTHTNPVVFSGIALQEAFATDPEYFAAVAEVMNAMVKLQMIMLSKQRLVQLSPSQQQQQQQQPQPLASQYYETKPVYPQYAPQQQQQQPYPPRTGQQQHVVYPPYDFGSQGKP